MKTLAAVLVETGRPLELLDLEIPALQRGQVLVEVEATGVCHTQLLECRGYRGNDPYLPHCLGHEGVARVLDVGPDVTRCSVGDRVLLSWIKAEQGIDVPGCEYRQTASPNRIVNAGGVTTFAEHSVVSENRVTRLQVQLDSAVAALIGCAAATGAGSIWNAAEVDPGESVAVFGVGGIGLCAVGAAALAEAEPVVAIDKFQRRLDKAAALGANVTLHADKVPLREKLREIAPHGFDHVIEATGRPAVMSLALELARPRGGVAVVIGNARHGEMLQIDPAQLNQGKRLLGVWGGDCRPDRDFPRLTELVSSGRLKLHEILEKRYSLKQVNAALADLESGRVTRPLISNQTA